VTQTGETDGDYVGGVGQFTAIDYGQAERAILALVENEDLRRRMGEKARIRARNIFDWAAIIPQYQALWAEQNARRLAAPPEAAMRDNPFRPDPFTLFQSYPTRHLRRDTRLVLEPGMTVELAQARLSHPLASYSAFHRPTLEEVKGVVEFLAGRESATVGEASDTAPQGRKSFVHRGLLWMARYGVIAIEPEPAKG
jgi:hypothetical protein